MKPALLFAFAGSGGAAGAALAAGATEPDEERGEDKAVDDDETDVVDDEPDGNVDEDG